MANSRFIKCLLFLMLLSIAMVWQPTLGTIDQKVAVLAEGCEPNGPNFVNLEPQCASMRAGLFVNLEPQCASMRAGFASDSWPSSPHANALRLKVRAIGREPSGTDKPEGSRPSAIVELQSSVCYSH